MGAKKEKHIANTRDYGIKPKLDWDYSENGHLLVGADLVYQDSRLEYIDMGPNPKLTRFFYKRDTGAVFFVNTNTWNNFEFSEGVRRDCTVWHNDVVEKNALSKPRRTTWNTAWSLSAAYNYSNTGRVHTRFERGFTGLDGMIASDEVYVKQSDGTKKKVLLPTPAKDEKFDIAEIGWNDAFDWTTVSVTGWMSHTPNQIVRVLTMDNGLVRKSRNLLDVKRRGLDLKFSQTFGPLELEEGYSYLYGKTSVKNKPGDFPPAKLNNPAYSASGLLRVPRHKFVLTAKLNLRDNLSVEGTYLYQGSYTTAYEKEKDGSDELLKGYEVVDLALYWEPRTNIKVSAGVTNLFDKEYFQYGGGSTVVIAPGRAFFAGLKATF